MVDSLMLWMRHRPEGRAGTDASGPVRLTQLFPYQTGNGERTGGEAAVAGPSNVMRSVSEWRGGGRFEHTALSGVPYLSDAKLEGYEQEVLKSASPMEMVLGALAGCTGLDVLSTLRKMRLDVKSLRIEVDAERRPEHPRIFTKIHVRYDIKTDPENAKKVLRAVKLSTDKYCAVSAMLAATADVRYTIHHGGEESTGVMHAG
ncbi:MAG: hypothetical protein GF355_05910 [Candidatus Eisenbacteria bacterium]|nr:hypothetical protein [Candidatus Eisenbacteria bacterium]